MIVIIGAGEIGSALGKILVSQNKKIEFWDKNPKKVKKQKPLEEIIPLAEIIFLAVPSEAILSVERKIGKFLLNKTNLIFLSKGIPSQGLLIPDLAEKLFSKNQWGFLGGPMIAEELIKGLLAKGMIASKFPKLKGKIKKLFEGSNLKIETSDDPKGVYLAGVLKNIYSIGLGIIEGLKLGSNFKGLYFVKALEEMKKIIIQLNGKANSVYTLAGIGDLIATGFSDYSKNYSVGLVLAKSRKVVKSEGVNSLTRLTLILKRTKSFPILNTLNQILKTKRLSLIKKIAELD